MVSIDHSLAALFKHLVDVNSYFFRTGINFIFYYSTPFLQSTGAISNSFLMSLIFTLVNVFSTPLSFWTVERFGRRFILIWGALGMLTCQFLVAIIGVTVGFNHTHPDPNNPDDTLANNTAAVNAQVAFIAIFIFFFASTWGPAAWIVIGEIFPLPIRSRGVALSTASNWLWNTLIGKGLEKKEWLWIKTDTATSCYYPLHGG